MDKLRFLLVLIAIFVFALAIGQAWKLKPETAAHHVVHKGELAILETAKSAPVWLCRDKESTYRMQQAMTLSDVAYLHSAAASASAFPVDSGAHVKVIAESVDKRQVEVVEGPQAGKSGWVEFEYLRPLRRSER